MQSVEKLLFASFVEALNDDLRALGAALRVDRRPPLADNTMTLVDDAGRRLGVLPDHTDAETIFAFENIIRSQKDDSVV